LNARSNQRTDNVFRFLERWLGTLIEAEIFLAVPLDSLHFRLIVVSHLASVYDRLLLETAFCLSNAKNCQKIAVDGAEVAGRSWRDDVIQVASITVACGNTSH